MAPGRAGAILVAAVAVAWPLAAFGGVTAAAGPTGATPPEASADAAVGTTGSAATARGGVLTGASTNVTVAVDGTNSPVEAGERLTVTATVRNVDARAVTRRVTLAVGDRQRATRSVTLGGGENRTVTLSWTTGDGDAGTYTARVATANDTAVRDVEVEEPSAGGGENGSNVGPAEPAIGLVPCAPECTGTPTDLATRDTPEWDDLTMERGRYRLEANASDPDGSIASYLWRIDGRVVSNGESLTYTFDERGDRELAVTVTDDQGASRTETVTVTVVNSPPVVQFVHGDGVCTGRGYCEVTANDPDGDVESYRWTVDGETVATGPETNLSFDSTGEHVVRVTVTDDLGASTHLTRTVSADGPNDPPTVSIEQAPSAPVAGDDTTFGAVVDDPDGEVTASRWWVDGEAVGDGRSLRYTFLEPGWHAVRVAVEDDDSARTTRRIRVRVNAPPTASIATTPDVGRVAPGENRTFRAEASDPDGEVVAYEWVVDGEPAGTGQALTYAFERDGDHEVRLTVTDDRGAVTTTWTSVRVGTVAPTPRLEVLAETTTPTAGQRVPFYAGGEGHSAANGTYRWLVDGELVGTGRTLTDGFAALAGNESDAAAGEELEIAFERYHRRTSVADDDGTGPVRVNDTITVAVQRPPVVDALVVESGADGGPRVGQPVRFRTAATDPDGTVTDYRWTVDGAEAGSGASTSYTFRTTGQHRVTVSVTDDDGARAVAERTLIVGGSNSPPVAAVGSLNQPVRTGRISVAPRAANWGPLYADAADGDGDVESYRWRVNGERVDRSRVGRADPDRGPPLSPGTHQVRLTVDDDDGARAGQTALVTVDPKPRPLRPGTDAPTDLDGDGRYEDVDGDGSAGYDDVVTLFEAQLTGDVGTATGAFDFNDNGRADFDDVVTLFEEM